MVPSMEWEYRNELLKFGKWSSGPGQGAHLPYVCKFELLNELRANR
jgi:hypothetical protein